MTRTYLSGAAALGLVGLLAASVPGPAQETASRAVVTSGSAPALVSTQDAGGYLGVTIAEVGDEEVERLGLPEERGALVQAVVEESPAAEAGFQEEDVVLRWGDEDVDSAAELTRLVRETPPGREMSVEVYRDGGRRQLTVEVGERGGRMRRALVRARMSDEDREELRRRMEEVRVRSEEARERMQEEMRERREEIREQMDEAREARERARVEVRRWRDSVGDLEFELPEGEASFFVFGGPGRMGVRLQSLSDQLAEYFGVGERKGALVTSVREDSPAAAAGLRAGDVIVGVGDDEVDDPGDVARTVRDAEEGPIGVTIVRDGDERTVTVELPEVDDSEFGFWSGDGEDGAFRFRPGWGGALVAPSAPGVYRIRAPRPPRAPGALPAPIRLRSLVAPRAPGVYRVDVRMPDVELPELPPLPDVTSTVEAAMVELDDVVLPELPEVDLRALELQELEAPVVVPLELGADGLIHI